MRGKRFGETRPGRDVCLQHYVRADQSGIARMRGMRLAESGTTKPAPMHEVSPSEETIDGFCPP